MIGYKYFERMIMMNEKRLPLKDSPIRVYSNYAYVLSALLNIEDAKNWVYSNFIQVKYIRDTKDAPRVVFNYSLGNLTKYFYNLPFLEVRSLSRSFLVKACGDTVDFLINALNDNYYIMIIADEYYLPPRKSYKLQHYQHLVMLNGFNIEKQCFYSAGYNDGKYEESKIGFGDIGNAVKSNEGNNKDIRDDFCMLYRLQDSKQLEFPQTGYNYFAYKFNPGLVKRSLKEYLNSECSDEHFDYFYEVPENAEYGISYYEAMMECLQKYTAGIYEGKIYEVAFHGMMEHKKVMIQRLEYMCEHNYLSGIDKEIAAYRELAIKAEITRNLVLKYNISRNINILSTVVTELKEMYMAEKKVVQLLIEAL